MRNGRRRRAGGVFLKPFFQTGRGCGYDIVSTRASMSGSMFTVWSKWFGGVSGSGSALAERGLSRMMGVRAC